MHNFTRRSYLAPALLFVLLSPLASQPAQNSLTGGGSAGPESDARQSAPSLFEIINQSANSFVDRFREAIGVESATGTEWMSNQSPRGTIFCFLQGMNEELYQGIDSSAKVRKTLPEGYSPSDQQVLALKSVFDRIGSIHPADLPATSDTITQTTNRFEVFPYAVDHEWVWQQLPEPPKGSIVVEKNSYGEWRFATETLEGAARLLESVEGIPPSFEGTPNSLNKKLYLPSFYTSPWWTWLIAAGGLIVACLLGRYLRRRLIKWGDQIEKKTKPLIGSLSRSIATSTAILAGTTVFILSSAFVELSPALSDLYWQCIKVVILIALVWVLFGLTDLTSTLVRYHVVKDNHEYGEMTVTIIQRMIRTFLFILIAVFILENVFGFSIGALLTGLGILGLALSLAGKETAQNLFGAISIFINRPFVVGDWVQFKGQIGEVSDVRMQATHIRLLSGEMLIVPNMQFISNEVENLAMRKYIRREMNIAIPYATKPEKVDQAVELIDDILRSEEVAREGKCDLEERPPKIAFDEFGEYYLNIKVYYWYFIGDKGEALQRNSERGWFSYLDHCTSVNQAILRAFNTEGIKFAFPTQTIALGKADAHTVSN